MRRALTDRELESTMTDSSTNRQPPDKGTGGLQVDSEGYLQDLDSWSPTVAHLLAAQMNLQLNEQHWELICLVRKFYERTEVVPAMRPLIKLVREQLGDQKGTSIHLNLLFPDGAAKSLARVAGLPKPTNCL